MPPTSPLGQFLHWEAAIPHDIFLRQPFNGQWTTWTWAEAGQECRKMANALRAMGLPERAHVAILSKNCAHWIMADIAIMMAGYISVPIYPTLSASSIEPILTHSDTAAIFVGKLDDYAAQKDGIPAHIQKIGFDMYEMNDGKAWTELINNNAPAEDLYYWQHDDLMTIIYTSGTTGAPKGVMHTAGNFDATMHAAISELRLPHRPRLFSYLPLSHIAERIGIATNAYYSGGVISFAESLTTFTHDVAAVQPDIFFAVPRLWGKFREGILSKMPQSKLNLLTSIPLLGNVVKKKIRHKLGLSRASHIYSAAAPISVDMIKWFDKLGVKITQALGMTEDCVYAHFERPFDRRMGSVGKPFKGLQVKISPEGELRVKSVSNTKGYYKEPELTKELFDEEGYLRTGDLCEYDHDGFLFITGRLKDQFKTDKGKYISPAPIEVKMLANPDVEQACVVGMGIPQPIVLVTLSEIGKAKPKAEVEASLLESIAAINPTLEHYEHLEKAVVMREPWLIDNGYLTPTMKVKRNYVEKLHQQFYPQWFHTAEAVVWE